MSDFEKLYGDVLITPEESAVISLESVVAALTEVALEVKSDEEVVLVDKDGAVFRKQDDGSFHLLPKRDYVIMRRSAKDLAAMIKKKEDEDKKEADRKARANVEVTSFAKRDKLRDIEVAIQKKWEEEKVFELDAPTTEEGRLQPKYMVTFPYPYMNGRLHLGHTFTLAKCEFAVGFERLKGKNAIFPFGFHCTGMPIKAAADKLSYEMETFGVPPQFPPVPETLDIRIFAHDPEKKKKKAGSRKSKAAAKSAGGKWQWDIMKNSDVPVDQIPAFAKGEHWIGYFPPLAIQDLKRMGAKIDWRRSFVTTDLNPYYDSFVRWQFNRLKAAGKIKFGKRNTIYSPKDKGACMDHERASGEGVTPTEYTIVKQQLLKPYPAALASLEATGKNVYLLPATLRPETMYGQTNCWVLASGEYGAFEFENDIVVCTYRAAHNMAYQTDDKLPGWGQVKQILTFTGQDLIGAALKAPLTPYEKIYVLPMASVLTNKGTGVVTSVPSDSPDDFTALRELIQKPDWRKKFGVTDEMVLPFKVINIINIPGLGDCAAQTVVEAMKIKSPNDRALLDKAKDEVYTKGFYSGTLIVGPYAGKKVEDVKALIRDELVAAGQAMPYAEPGSEVISRSGDECVVALIDQWYLDYGEKDWLALAQKCLANMNTFGAEARQMMEHGLSWMTKWACSRSFGLGTRLPWDEIFLIDSLSDSTIYMAYYTVAQMLHTDLEGSKMNPEYNIAAKDLTDAVWDYIFLGKAIPADAATTIPKATLDKARNEFTYWYPVDLRVSGKDLVNNHLLFWIYNHVALFEEAGWPKGVRPNGHVLLNKMKMAKSTGNFISLYDGVERFTADGMRFALADAGDGITDANFTTDSADGALLKLHTQLDWIEDMLKELPTLRTGEFTFLDKVFANQIALAIDLTDKAFSNMEYKEGVKTGFFELQVYRDTYQDICKLEGVKMHADLIQRFIRVQALLLSPICPHWAEYVWTKLLNEPKSILNARYPVNDVPVDQLKLVQYAYLEKVLHTWRLKVQAYVKPKKGPAQPQPANALIVVAKRYPAWHETTIKILEKLYKEKGAMPEQAALLEALRAEASLSTELNKAMAVARTLSTEFETRGNEVFSLTLAWDELAMLLETQTYIAKSLNIPNVSFKWSDDPEVPEDKRAIPTPGNPAIFVP